MSDQYLELGQKLFRLEVEEPTVSELNNGGFLQPGFLEYLAAQATNLATGVSCKQNLPLASQIFVWVELLERSRRTVKVRRLMGMEIPPGSAYYFLSISKTLLLDSWWLVQPPWFLQLMESLSRKIDLGELDRETASTLIEKRLLAVKDELGGEQPPAQVGTTLQACFCCYRIYFTAQDALQELARFKKLLATEGLEDAVYASLCIRYILVARDHLYVAPAQRAFILELIRIADAGLSRTDIDKYSQLHRDFLQSKARMFALLAAEDAKYFAQAINLFEQGLNVESVIWERQERGKALCDYANTLWWRSRALGGNPDQDILNAFHEALALLVGPNSKGARAHILQSMATYYNEREIGLPQENQAKALSLVDDAIGLLEQVRDEDLNPHNLALLASAWLLRGNSIKTFGALELKEAMDSYQIGLELLPEDSHATLRGTIKLAIAQLREQERGVQDSYGCSMAYQEAIEHLTEAPLAQITAEVYSIALRVSSEGYQEEEVGGIRDCLAALQVRADATENVFLKAKVFRERARIEARLDESPAGLAQAASYYRQAAAESVLISDRWGAAIDSFAEASCTWKAFRLDSGNTSHCLSQVSSALRLGLAQAQQLAAESQSILWRWTVTELQSLFLADMTYVAAFEGRPVEEVVSLARQAKNLELILHTRSVRELQNSDSETLRRLARSYESDTLTTSRDRLLEVLEGMRESLAALTEDAPGAPVPQAPPQQMEADELVFDFTVGRWGTVLCAAGPRLGVSPVVRMAEVTRDTVDEFEQLLPPSAGNASLGDVEIRVQKIVDDVSEKLYGPLLDQFCDALAGAHLTIVPHALSGLPLSLARVRERPLYEVVSNLAYSPASQGSGSTRQRVRPSKPVLVVADAANKVGDQLPLLVEEVGCIAKLFVERDCHSKIAGTVGRLSGRRLFASRQIAFADSDVEIVEDLPTPAWFLENLAEHDFVLFSGHGFSHGGVNCGLHLVGPESSRDLSALAVLSSPSLQRSPVVILSACRTSREDGSAANLTSVASCFLRIGASNVVANLWDVPTSAALAATTKFTEELLNCSSPSRAYVEVLRAFGREGAPFRRWGCITLWSSPG